MPSEALFEPLPDGTFLPTDSARGPWSPKNLHGGPPAALLATAIETAGQTLSPPSSEPVPFVAESISIRRQRVRDGGAEGSGDGSGSGSDGGLGMQVVRVTVELLRPIEVTPLTIVVQTTRPGKKVRLVEARMLAGDTEVARATGLLVRRTHLDLPNTVPTLETPPPIPDALDSPTHAQDYEAFHNQGVEMRTAEASFDKLGPAKIWMRLRQPVIAGTELTPLQRAVAVSDFNNGISSVLEFGRWMFINPDLTVTLHRLPQGEWVLLDAVSYIEPDGLGMAESLLWDERGPIGRSVQALLVDRL
jgi:acyl-coenzyme A thioesterase PaaI-like protein